MPPRWPREREAELAKLVESGRYTYVEIAKTMGLKKNQVATKASNMGLQNPAYLQRITKHKHLREPAMRYFLNHTWKETRDRFGLTDSELKSLFTVGYRDPDLKHLRKETRRHDAWTTKEVLFLLRHAGVQPRAWIAKRLKRGSRESVKEQLSRLGTWSKHLNGMPWNWAVLLFGESAHDLVIKTNAGPTADRGQFQYRIIPWTECEMLLDRGETRRITGKGRWSSAMREAVERRVVVSDDIAISIRALARFQRWIHGTRSSAATVRSVQKALGGKLR